MTPTTPTELSFGYWSEGLNTNCLSTEREGFTRKSQMKTMPGKVKAWDFPVKTKRSKLISYLLYGILLCLCRPVSNLWALQEPFPSPEAAPLLVSTRITTSGPVQGHFGFEWLCKHNRPKPKPIRFVRLDSEHAQSDRKSVNCGLPVLDLARGCDSWCGLWGRECVGT